MAEAGSSLFFLTETDYELYEYDGSGTTLLTNSLPAIVYQAGIHAVGDYVYFQTGSNIGRSDGSTTEAVTSGWNDIVWLFSDGTNLYFGGEEDSGDGVDIFKFDPSDSSVTQLTTIGNLFDEPGCSNVKCGNIVNMMGDLLVVYAQVPDEEGEMSSEGALYAYDTSTGDYDKITNTMSGGYDDVRYLHVFESTLYFTAVSDIDRGSTPDKIRQLYTSDGTLSGTSLASSEVTFGTYEYHQVMIEIDDSIVTWAYAGSSVGREIVHDQATLTTISYSY